MGADIPGGDDAERSGGGEGLNLGTAKMIAVSLEEHRFAAAVAG